MYYTVSCFSLGPRLSWFKIFTSRTLVQVQPNYAGRPAVSHHIKYMDLEIHFGQFNLLKLFLFKTQKDLCSLGN